MNQALEEKGLKINEREVLDEWGNFLFFVPKRLIGRSPDEVISFIKEEYKALLEADAW